MSMVEQGGEEEEGSKGVNEGWRRPPCIGEEGAASQGVHQPLEEAPPPHHGGNPLINMR
jgi:hypothetical protein